ncbi:hypothetical protein BDV10DRAFT_191627 [Aspergillus recurvatus]
MPSVHHFFPPGFFFVEKHILSLTGKVATAIGATFGVGVEHAAILYSENATVYIAVRSADKASKAASADESLQSEDRLYILIHTAGVMHPPAGSETEGANGLSMVELGTVWDGIVFDDQAGASKFLQIQENYRERIGGDGLFRLSPSGLMKTELQNISRRFLYHNKISLVLKPVRYGACTELFAALSPWVTAKHNESYNSPGPL